MEEGETDGNEEEYDEEQEDAPCVVIFELRWLMFIHLQRCKLDFGEDDVLDFLHPDDRGAKHVDVFARCVCGAHEFDHGFEHEQWVSSRAFEYSHDQDEGIIRRELMQFRDVTRELAMRLVGLSFVIEVWIRHGIRIRG